jgi:para-aminobenzoate synthetase / 4-amino-4-deoxychorismate lyase
MMKCPYVFLEDQLAGRRRLYLDPCEVITAYKPEDVSRALARMEICKAQGKYLAGYISYELGYVFEDKLRPLHPNGRNAPLLQFGVFDAYSDGGIPSSEAGQISGLEADWNFKDYKTRFDKVMAWIRSGDVYQVNLTFPMRGTYQGDGAAIYERLKSAQPVRYGGVISLGGVEIVSLSPELFFEIAGDKISMRPMKGTLKRGDTKAQDIALAKALQADTKNRAENLMIVDLLRNDLSRIAKTGSVQVTDLFSLETYPSLHTMTSGIEAQLTDMSLEQVLCALFPCGSVTGAPKIRAMEIISTLESRPRGAYCGALGLIDPPRKNNNGGYSRFNVGIRTLGLHADGRCRYDVGSGIVADSNATEEYAECLLKAAFLQNGFGLIETFGWHPQTGLMWMDLHMARLKQSAAEFGFIFSETSITQAVHLAVKTLTGPQKIRLELSKDGAINITTSPLRIANTDEALPVTMSKNPRSSVDTLLAHKTTRRDFIEAELKRLTAKTGCGEVLFFNENEELCEGSYTNVFILKHGQMLTPPVASGLLPGVLRQALIEAGQAHEQVLTLDDIRTADEIYIGNSVRGLMPARLTSPIKQ